MMKTRAQREVETTMMKRRASAFTDIYDWAIRNKEAFTALEKKGRLTSDQADALEFYEKIISMAVNRGATYEDEVVMMMSI